MGYETLTGGLPESEGPKSGAVSEGARGDSGSKWMLKMGHADLAIYAQKLEKALTYAASGLSMAYDALDRGFYDEAMLHVGHHHAKVCAALAEPRHDEPKGAR